MWQSNEPESSMLNYISDINTGSSNFESHTKDEDDSSLLEELKNISGCLGVHGVEENPWNDRARPHVKLNDFKDLQLTEEESSGKLTERMVAACLSYLEQSPVIFNFALCKCVLSRKNLIDISVLKNYHYLQYLDLSRNNITNLKSLGQMPFLQYLNVSENGIENLLDFKPPLNLYHVDFSKNSVSTIPDLSEFWAISYLNLAYNEIGEINGLENLRFLTHLDISHNNIREVKNLTNMRIRHLLLDNNNIDVIDMVGISTLCYIRSVNLSHNKLSSLKFVRKIENVENVDVSHNNISDLLEVYYMKGLRYLTRVNLCGNPLSSEPQYFTICIRKIKNLRFLDNTEITAERKINASTKSEISYLFPARQSRMELFLLQQINRPKIGGHIVPYDQPPPDVIMVVGPTGSRKKTIVRRFMETQKRIFRGLSFTTRPMRSDEENEEDYYFVTNEKFLELARKGEFISISEFNGYSYGIAYDELRKCSESVVVFHSDIQAALTLKVMGICPKLVLAMPRSEETHLKWLTHTYTFDYVANSKEMRIRNCPLSFHNAEGDTIDEVEEEMQDESTLGMDDLNELMTYGDEGFRNAEDTEYYRNLYRRNRSETSIHSDQRSFEDDSRRTSDKSWTGILKHKESEETKEKFGTKRVSFSWMANPEDEVTDDNVSTSAQSRTTHKSISDSCLRTQNEPQVQPTESFVGDNHLLSVLSSTKLVRGSEGETVYMSVAERLEQLQMEKMRNFFDQILKTRKELLELHWENPGLFRAVIFTDDEDDCLEQLRALLQYTVECHNTSKQIFSLDHPSFTEMLNSRLKSLKLDETYFARNDMEDSCI